MSVRPTRAGIDREVIRRRGFYAFVQRAWHVLDPHHFVPNWHLEVLCKELERIATEPDVRLVINIPPGMSKSVLVCVLLPAWLWTVDPLRRIIAASYGDSLSKRDGRKTKLLCSSDWYRERWPASSVDPDQAETDFTNESGGYRIATTTKGMITGRHADLILIDDPTKPLDAFGRRAVTGVELGEAREWLKSTMTTRALPGASKVLIMQRLAVDDLSNHCLRLGWKHARFPMRAEGAAPCPESEHEHECMPDPRAEGELLQPERYDEKKVSGDEKEMGEAASAAQLQQRPSPLGGGVFKTAWLGHRWRRPLDLRGAVIFQAWDCSFKDSEGSDFVAGTVWAWIRAKAHLLALFRGRWGIVETIENIQRAKRLFPATGDILVEDAANGAAVCELLTDKLPQIVLVPTLGGKVARAHATTGLWKAGDVLLPPDDWRGPDPKADPLEPAGEWLPAFIHEHVTFRKDAPHDDMVDSTSHALIYMRDNYGWLEEFSAGTAA